MYNNIIVSPGDILKEVQYLQEHHLTIYNINMKVYVK